MLLSIPSRINFEKEKQNPAMKHTLRLKPRKSFQHERAAGDTSTPGFCKVRRSKKRPEPRIPSSESGTAPGQLRRQYSAGARPAAHQNRRAPGKARRAAANRNVGAKAPPENAE